jgi:hypothetical protein
MSYNPDIPQASDFISSSQGDLLTNFQALNTVFAVDHNTFNAPSNAGTHLKVTLPTTLSPPPTVTGLGSAYYSTTYTPASPASPYAQPTFINANGASTIWSGGTTYPNVNFSNAGNGYVVFPNGLTIQWGQTANGTGTKNVSFPRTFSSVFSIQPTPFGVTGGAPGFSVASQSAAGFSILNSGNAAYYWSAIGTS